MTSSSPASMLHLSTPTIQLIAIYAPQEMHGINHIIEREVNAAFDHLQRDYSHSRAIAPFMPKRSAATTISSCRVVLETLAKVEKFCQMAPQPTLSNISREHLEFAIEYTDNYLEQMPKRRLDWNHPEYWYEATRSAAACNDLQTIQIFEAINALDECSIGLALQSAVQNDHPRVVCELVPRHENGKYQRGFLLQSAARAGSVRAMKEILTSGSIDEAPKEAALLTAATNNQLAVVRELLANHSFQFLSMTEAIMAATQNKHTQVAAFLLEDLYSHSRFGGAFVADLLRRALN